MAKLYCQPRKYFIKSVTLTKISAVEFHINLFITYSERMVPGGKGRLLPTPVFCLVARREGGVHPGS